MRVRLRDWLINQHPHGVIKTELETLLKLKTSVLGMTLWNGWKDKLKTGENIHKSYEGLVFGIKDSKTQQ